MSVIKSFEDYGLMQTFAALAFVGVMAGMAVAFYKEGSELGQFASALFVLIVGLSIAAMTNLI